MSEVRTRDEAIGAVDRALQDWAVTFTGVLTQAGAAVSGARSTAEQAVNQWASKVAAIEAILSAAAEGDRRRLEAELVRARARHDRARRASVKIADIASAVIQLARLHAAGGVSMAGAARGKLSAMSGALEGYRSGGGMSGGGGMGGAGAAPSRSAGVNGAHSSLVGMGLSDLDVGAADLADTPIQGEFGRGGASRADYRWAVQAWSDIVGPGVANGMTRDDFAARDERNGAQPLRRTTDVHDMFLGTDRIRVDRRADGSLNVVNGRHRLQIARDLGIKTLPGQVS